MIDRYQLKKIIERSGILVVLGVFSSVFGAALLEDSSYDSWRFGRIDFGEYGVVVGGVFLVLGIGAVIGAVVNAILVTRRR